MSAFVVSRETINCVCSAIDRNRHIRKQYPNLDVIGRRLWAMNGAAVSQRYGEDPRPLEPFAYRMGSYTPIQELKAVQCLAYQCSEGDVPETWPEFKLLKDLLHRIAMELLRELPGYAAAQWDLRDVAAV